MKTKANNKFCRLLNIGQFQVFVKRQSEGSSWIGSDSYPEVGKMASHSNYYQLLPIVEPKQLMLTKRPLLIGILNNTKSHLKALCYLVNQL